MYRYFTEKGVQMIEIEVDATTKVVRPVIDEDKLNYPRNETDDEAQRKHVADQRLRFRPEEVEERKSRDAKPLVGAHQEAHPASPLHEGAERARKHDADDDEHEHKKGKH